MNFSVLQILPLHFKHEPALSSALQNAIDEPYALTRQCSLLLPFTHTQTYGHFQIEQEGAFIS